MKKKNKDKKIKKEKFVDDGRTIADMNVDGMPWFHGRRVGERQSASDGEQETFDFNSLSPEEKKIYRKETRRIIWGVILRFLPFLLTFIAAFAALIICLYFLW